MSSAPHSILCINSGSSSLKYALFAMEGHGEQLLVRGAIERIGLDAGGCPDHAEAVERAFAEISTQGHPIPVAVGHRVVHGGAAYTTPARVDATLLAALKNLIPFAPLHLPSEILGIEAIAARFPALSQVACFDTAFHRRMPEIAQRFALPREFWDEGIRRYGFHGLSYEYIMSALGPTPPARVVIAHLGNGASMAAVHKGVPQETTMGFTPAGGFMMGTRPGDIDPGILIHLARAKGLGADALDEIVNNRSGLLGVSGISPDMKTLLEQRGRNPNAAQAIEMFCYQARKTIGGLAAVLGGLDLLVFTGGIGERAAPVRASICEGLGHLGIVVDGEQNKVHANVISAPSTTCTVRVIPANEDVVIARHTRGIIAR